jgi:hypothetical protein
MPPTRLEDERLGPLADQAKDSVKGIRQEALERGRQVAQEAAGSATETVRQRGPEQGPPCNHKPSTPTPKSRQRPQAQSTAGGRRALWTE